MEDRELKDLGIFELMTMLEKGIVSLEGCSIDEARNFVIKDVKEFLIKEIEWVGDMLEK